MRWEGLESLASIPCQSGTLVRIRYRQTVVVLPPEAEQIRKEVPHDSELDPEHPNQMSHAPPNSWTTAALKASPSALSDPLFRHQQLTSVQAAVDVLAAHLPNGKTVLSAGLHVASQILHDCMASSSRTACSQQLRIH